MTGSIRQALALRHRQWRRARNMRPGGRRSIAAAIVLAVAGGGAVIAGHARYLGKATEPDLYAVQETAVAASIDALQAVVPGASFRVPSNAGMSVQGQVVIAAGMRASPTVRVDLCSQMAGGAQPRILPVRIGYQFADVARMVNAATRPIAMRNVALADAAMPRLTVTGLARPDFAHPLQLAWDSMDARVRWAGDAGNGRGAKGQVALRSAGWLIWQDSALRVVRRTSNACPAAGELVLQLYRKGESDPARALVTAFPALGKPVTAWLRPGRYQVPSVPRASLEDQALFHELSKRGLLRLGAAGLVEVAPRDLASWQAAPGSARVGELASWNTLARDDATMQLFKRLYRMADGAYVREQVRVFNSERRLLAWRVRGPAAWQASVADAPVATSTDMPLAAARLFADVPQGWAPWNRIAAWHDAGSRTRISMSAPAAAPVDLLLVGQLLGVAGARLLGARDACSGRACPSAGSARVLTLAPLPGARSITIVAAPLEMSGLAHGADQQYRHLRVANGQLAWQPLAHNSGTARRAAPAGVVLVDRNGALLWSGGAPSSEATRAGLAGLLGLRAEHASSVAGMLARLPAPDGAPHTARLTLDLALQAASQGALDCIGMRQGRWDGARCSGGQAPPAGRQAGLVIVDTESGDVLAAAGAGTGAVDAANWSEVRDFDRANPARSPLRLPAFQHDGGAHRSPGSTFKIISALGLELAAETDPQVESLLSGMALPAINRMAARKGFAFQTNAASYPYGTRLAHITNYKDQHLDRRAQDGKLGLAQALTYSLNTWFAWSGELSDRSLFGRAEGGAPDLQALEEGALDRVRPIAAMAHRLGFEQELRLDGGLLPPDFAWSGWDALQASRAHIDPVHTRHELRQMAIGLRMQVTPLHMALVSGAVGQGRVVAPRLLLELDGRQAVQPPPAALGVRLDRIRDGMKGVVDAGTAAGAFHGAIRAGLSGKTGTSPSLVMDPDGVRRELATVWFTGWLEPGSVPGQKRRLAVAAFVSHSDGTGGGHAAPVVAAVLSTLEQKGK
ncbi:MAG: penicillin-binding transpeptidase domain-containing protein [Pseudomonadota bacterium]